MTKKHQIHKYRRVDIGVSKPYYVFRCMLPDCNHYVTEKLIINRRSICWNCNQPFVITKHKMKPVCDDCKAPKSNDDEKVAEILKGIGVI